MFNFKSRYKSDDEKKKEYEKLEKEYIRKVKKRLKEESKYTDEQKLIVKNMKIIIIFYILSLFIIFSFSLLAGIVFSFISAPLLLFILKNKYPVHCKLIPFAAGLVCFYFFFSTGLDYFIKTIDEKRIEKQVSEYTNKQNNYAELEDYVNKYIEIMNEHEQVVQNLNEVNYE